MRRALAEASSGGHKPRSGDSDIEWQSGRAFWKRGHHKSTGRHDEKRMTVCCRGRLIFREKYEYGTLMDKVTKDIGAGRLSFA